MIAMDACHTKNKKYPTLLFLATVVDGNSNILVLAYGIAPVEDRETWCWFVENLKHAIHGLASPNVLIVSDRQKGLVDAVADELPSNEHVHCTFHLRMNLKRHFGAQVAQYFHRLIYAETKDIFEDALKDLEERFPNGKEAVQYINGIDRTKFARYAMKLPRYGRVTSNLVECMNGAFLKLRVYAARRLIFEVWTYMMRKFYKRRVAAETSVELLTKYAKDRLSEFEREFGRYVTCNSDQNVALVQTNGGAEQFVVNRLPRLSCTCFESQEMLWPCIHVMSWCRSKGEDYLQFVDRIYFQKSLAACYSQNIPPITEQDLKVSVTCRAPEPAIRRGRARMVRIPNGGGRGRRRTEYSYPVRDEPRFIPSQGPRSAPQTETGAGTSTRVAEEGAGPSTQAAKAKGTRRCGVCREVGHRRDTCPVRKQTEALRAQYFQEN
ncbi:hypothetical protein R1sor_022065 [Riccia sorocarpa]|uniref:MULE transposase domain-containing protein n=1 Tax=Riccia sorocarpa TaxID=122646 RepID=A0ABD3GKZ8_9MARC